MNTPEDCINIKSWNEYDLSKKGQLSLAMQDKGWRLNNLYHISNKQGVDVIFKVNEVQRVFFETMWFSNVILKSRQHGISTAIAIWLLDECLFRPGFNCAIISENEDRANDIFRTKIRYPYERLINSLKIAVPTEKITVSEYHFSNESAIFATIGWRGGTLQAIHISELGKISTKFPEKAKEIISGALETTTPGQYRFVESTSEGQTGYFAEMCKKAQAYSLTKKPLTALDYKFHFFPWWQDSSCKLDINDNLDITPEMAGYFKKVESKNEIKLTDSQKLFYIKKKDGLGEECLKQYPSTWDECFSGCLQGTFFYANFIRLRKDNRICNVPVLDGVLVDTWWDMGFDCTSVWFTQDYGRAIHVVDYYEDAGEGLEYNTQKIKDKGYRLGNMTMPHDSKHREYFASKTRAEIASGYGLKFDSAELVHVPDQIEAARKIFSLCYFDEKRCKLGLERLEAFRKEWDSKREVWKNTYAHDISSHGASAFMTMAIMHKFGEGCGRDGSQKRIVETNTEYCW